MSDSKHADAELLTDLQSIMADSTAPAVKPDSLKAKLSSERLEDRVLYSATWAEAVDTQDMSALKLDAQSGIKYEGTAGNDVSSGGDGNDYLSGLAGNDTLRGGLGDDLIVGGIGNDALFGDAGNDTFGYREGDGTDRFNGGDGWDVVDASEAKTLSVSNMTATDSIETVLGSTGGTRIAGTSDANQFDFRNTSLKNISEIDAGAGNDTVQGSQGNDVILGGAGNDALYGNGGNDVLNGGTGNDSLFGNDGDDLFIYRQGDGSDRFNGGNGADIVDAREAKNLSLLHMTGSDSIETIIGREGGTRIEGTTAANQFDFSKTSLKNISEIDAGAGNDTVRGSQNNDVIIGGTGNDNLFGNNGDDTFIYRDRDGTDRFNGGNGFDVVSATNAKTLGLLHATASDSIEAIVGNEGGTRIVGTAAANQFDFRKTTLKNISEIDAGAGNDIVYGSSADDVILASGGNDSIFGDVGTDTVKFTGKFSDYKIAPGSSGTWTVQDLRAGSPDGTDTIQTVEKFQFADGFADVGKTVNFFPNQLEIRGNQVAENSPVGTVVVQFGSNDAVAKNFKFELVDAKGNSIEHSDFAIDGNRIVVKKGADIDYESSNSRELNVRVTGSNGSNYVTPVKIDITNVNEGPTGQAFRFSAAEDSRLTGNVLRGSSDVDGDELQVSNFSQPAHGVVVVNKSGEFSYQPAENFHGTDSFTYTISDGNGGTFTEKVVIEVSSVNDAPVATGYVFALEEDGSAVGNVLVNAVDIDGDHLVVCDFSQPTHGEVVVDVDGSFIYKPTANFSGTDSFTYSVADGNGGQTTQTVALTVKPVADGVTIEMFRASGQEHRPLSLDLNVALQDVDGSESITSVMLKNIPATAKLSAGLHQADGSWLLTAQELRGLTMQFNRLGNSDFDLVVEVTTRDGKFERVQSQAFAVDVRQDALLATMFQQFLAGKQIVEFPTLAEIEDLPTRFENSQTLDLQSDFQTESSSEQFTPSRFEITSDDWNSSQWDQVHEKFGTTDSLWEVTTSHQSGRVVEANSIAIEQPMFLMDFCNPHSLQMEEGAKYTASELAQHSIELENWDTFIDSGEVSDTSKMTAASLLTLFTIKEDNRRKLKGRNEITSNDDKANDPDQ